MNSKEDEQWFAALAGKPDLNASAGENAQARAVRIAMLARREALERRTQQLDPGEYVRLQERLKKEGLLDRQRPSSTPASKGIRAWFSHWLSEKNGRAAKLPLWSLAANVVLLVVVIVNVGLPTFQQKDDENVLRSGQGTVLRVADPQARLAELISGLNDRSARYVVKRKVNGDTELVIQASDTVLDYLIEQRINASISESVVTITISHLGK